MRTPLPRAIWSLLHLPLLALTCQTVDVVFGDAQPGASQFGDALDRFDSLARHHQIPSFYFDIVGQMDHVGLCVIRKQWRDLLAIRGKGFFQHSQDGWFSTLRAGHGSCSYERVIAEDC